MTGPADAGLREGSADERARERRPWIERIGLAGIAIVLGGLFAFMAWPPGRAASRSSRSWARSAA